MSPRRLWLPGIQVHIVTPMAPPPSNVKNPSEVGLSSSSMILGIKLIHPSSAPVSRAMYATICVSSSMLNFTRSICRSSRATRGVSQLAALHSAAQPGAGGSRPWHSSQGLVVGFGARHLSKANRPAHIATALPLRAPQHHRQSCSGGASALPTNCRPRRQRFPGVRTPEPDRAPDGTGHYERAGKITVFGRRPLCERRSPFLVRCPRPGTEEAPSICAPLALRG